MDVYESLIVFRDAKRQAKERRTASVMLEQYVRKVAMWNTLVKAGRVHSDDLVQTVLIRLLVTDVASRIAGRNPDADTTILDRLAKGYIAKMVNSSASNMNRKTSKGGELAEGGDKPEPEIATFMGGDLNVQKVLEDLYHFERDRTKRARVKTSLEQSMRELEDMWLGKTTLEALAHTALEEKEMRGKESSYKKEYDALCKRHERFRSRLRGAKEDFIESQGGSLFAPAIVEFVLDSVFPRRSGGSK